MNKIFKGCAPQNFRVGRHGFKPEVIVIHIIVGSQTSCDNTFLDPHLDVRRSAHYSVGKTGEIHQYVSEDDTAYHAGVIVSPSWTKIRKDSNDNYINPNYYTIGIEHEGFPEDVWPDSQYAASRELIADIRARFPQITLDRDHIIMHRQIRASKTCPGFKFDMNWLINGAAVPVNPVNQSLAVKTTMNANLRRGAPSTAVPIVRTIPADTTFAAVGFTATGQSVKANSNWYQDADGNYLWAGTTDRPSPP